VGTDRGKRAITAEPRTTTGTQNAHTSQNVKWTVNSLGRVTLAERMRDIAKLWIAEASPTTTAASAMRRGLSQSGSARRAESVMTEI
jgi:hypothetical protein